ncbi:hypothetical protein V6N12_002715 [Hibiscus sabdariffa]|uniref:Uncharacterized protein n=1 Tax=Hibiscus sabdariffa TaxID=183260 RepID=A0ABR2E9T0_9ROSI
MSSNDAQQGVRQENRSWELHHTMLHWKQLLKQGSMRPYASINPMQASTLCQKSVFQNLGIGEAKPTTLMLQLADYSYVQPEGKIEDILVQVDKFIFPVDFLILDCETDKHASIILGRHFLATGRVLLDFEMMNLC